MNAQRLLDAMTQLAAEEREACFAEARREIDAVLEQAHRKATERRERALMAAREELERAKRQQRVRAEAAAQREALSIREAVAEDVLATVKESIEALASSPHFTETLEALLAEIAPEAAPGGRVLAPPEHVETCKQWLANHGLAACEVVPTHDLKDGVVLESADRTVRITNTLSERFARREREARRLCMKTLFPEVPEYA